MCNRQQIKTVKETVEDRWWLRTDGMVIDVLAGIASWGIGSGEANQLEVYTSVLSHVDWVKNTCGIHN